jgi:hypothetical protein
MSGSSPVKPDAPTNVCGQPYSSQIRWNVSQFRPALAGLELPVLPDAHPEPPRRLPQRPTRPASILLGEYLGTVSRGSFAFPDAGGGPLRVTNWNRRTFTPAATNAGLIPPKLRVHDLRHTAASLMVASGAGVKLVQSQLGHRTATLTLDRYAHLFPDELDALSNALDGLRERTPADSLRTVPAVEDLGAARDAL